MTADDKARSAIEACVAKLTRLFKGKVEQRWIDYFVGTVLLDSVTYLVAHHPGKPGRKRKHDGRFNRGLIACVEQSKSVLRDAGKRATDKAAIEYYIRSWLIANNRRLSEGGMREQVSHFQKRLSDARQSENRTTK